MKEIYINIPLFKNETKNSFEIEVEGSLAFIDYKILNNQVALVHTEVSKALEGRGIAAALVEKTLNYLKEKNKSILPFCPYVFSYIKKHPEWKPIVSKQFNGYNKL